MADTPTERARKAQQDQRFKAKGYKTKDKETDSRWLVAYTGVDHWLDEVWCGDGERPQWAPTTKK